MMNFLHTGAQMLGSLFTLAPSPTRNGTSGPFLYMSLPDRDRSYARASMRCKVRCRRKDSGWRIAPMRPDDSRCTSNRFPVAEISGRYQSTAAQTRNGGWTVESCSTPHQIISSCLSTYGPAPDLKPMFPKSSLKYLSPTRWLHFQTTMS